MKRVLPVLVLALLAAPLVAQGPSARPGINGIGFAGLVTNKGVIEELKMTDEQKEKLAKTAKEVSDKHKDDLAAARKDKDREKTAMILKEMNGEVSKVVDSTLKPEQVKRLHQIQIWTAIQAVGLDVFSNEKVEKALKLTEKQQANLKEIRANLDKAVQEAMQAAQGDLEKIQESFAKSRKSRAEAFEKFQGTLSDEQKKAWKELTGEKFEFKFGGAPR